MLLTICSRALLGSSTELTNNELTSNIESAFPYDVSKAKSILLLQNALVSIPDIKRGRTHSKPVPWIYTNDHDFDKIVGLIEKSMVGQEKGNRLRVALVSGAGSIVNVARFLKVDAIVAIDCNKYVLDQIREMAFTVCHSSNRDIYQQSRFFLRMGQFDAETEHYWEMEKISFGDWHFLASETNFSAARSTLSRIALFTTQGDLTYLPYIQALADALQNTDIVYASFTDLAEWCPAFFDFVHILHISEQTPILWSTNQVEGKPEARFSIGLDQYIKEGKAAADKLRVSYFNK